MIVAPDWLFLECYRKRDMAPIARQLYRAFVLLAKRTGHVLDLDAESSRRQVMLGLRNHRVQHCAIPCVRCGCVAWLDDWVRCSEMTAEMRDSVIRDNPARMEAGMLDFLLRCPGDGRIDRALEGPHPPEVV